MEYIIQMAIGIYITLVGFRVISVSKKRDEKYEGWHRRWGLFFKIAGPALIVIGIVRLLMAAK